MKPRCVEVGQDFNCAVCQCSHLSEERASATSWHYLLCFFIA
nr:MAG TPA: hypothetical protein [Caudoviricetes sp.]